MIQPGDYVLVKQINGHTNITADFEELNQDPNFITVKAQVIGYRLVEHSQIVIRVLGWPLTLTQIKAMQVYIHPDFINPLEEALFLYSCAYKKIVPCLHCSIYHEISRF